MPSPIVVRGTVAGREERGHDPPPRGLGLASSSHGLDHPERPAVLDFVPLALGAVGLSVA